jgi:hypothetical protein
MTRVGTLRIAALLVLVAGLTIAILIPTREALVPQYQGECGSLSGRCLIPGHHSFILVRMAIVLTSILLGWVLLAIARRLRTPARTQSGASVREEDPI